MNYRCWIQMLLLVLTTRELEAQESTRPDSTSILQEVVVTYQADERTPITFQNISAKELDARSTGQEPSFLLSETPSITNYSDAGSYQGYSYFRLRGIDQTRINLTIDGVPLNEPEDQGAYFSNFPDILNSVSKVQIQRGVGTSKNGVANFGGSIQLTSPNLHDSNKTTFGLGYGSFNSLRAFAEYSSGLKNHKAIYARASEVYSEGYKYNSSNNAQSVFISGGLIYDKTTWKINLLVGHQQNQLAWLGVRDSLIDIDRRTNANKNEKDNFTQCLTQVQNRWQISKSSSLQSSVYYTFLKGNYDFNLNNYLGLPSTEEMYNYAFQSNLVGVFSNYTWTREYFNLTLGVHGNTYDRRHAGSEENLGELYENTGCKNELSAFSKVEYRFRQFNLFADIQYRYSTFNYRGSVPLDKLGWQFFNPKGGISTELKHDFILYYSIGRTGREPTRNDMFGGSDDLLADSSGNPILSITTPEYVLDHELGFRHHSRKWTAGLNLFYMDFKNEIVLNGKYGPNGLALTNNVDQSFRTGVEMSCDFQVGKHLTLINNSSFNYSRIKEQEVSFTPILTPQLIINQEAVYSFKRVLVAASVRYQDQSFIDFANTETLKSYLLLNARIGYKAGGFQFFVFVNNVTNSKYFNNGYVDVDGSKAYFVQSPMNFYASISYSF